MYKPTPLGLSRPSDYRSRHPEAWPRLYSPNTRSNRAGSRLPAWVIIAAAVSLVLAAEFGPDLVAGFIFGG